MKTDVTPMSPGLVIPYDLLSSDALTGLIDEFILREGTDYGSYEYSLAQKHEQILKQLVAGRIVVVFDPVLETSSLLRKEDVPKAALDFEA